MKPGNYFNCKVTACGLGFFEEKKTPYAWIELENADGESIEHKLFLTDKIMTNSGKAVKEASIDKLIEIGYQGKKLTDLSNPEIPISTLFTHPIDGINIVVEEEAMTEKDGTPMLDKEGKTRMKSVVRWVNVRKPDLSKIRSHAVAVKVFQPLNLDGLLVERRKNIPQPAPKQPDVQTKFADDDPPF